MTDKEQIIIDGIDVSECLFYQSNFKEDYDVKIKHFCSIWHNSCESINNSNCYFKQLARKTQECEELKEENQKLEMQLCNDCGERDDYNIPCKMIRDLDYGLQKEIEENDRYRKALEEIEDVVKQTCRYRCTNDCLGTRKHCGYGTISNIISKVKR